MLNSRSNVGSSSEKERLRALVGLNKHMNSEFLMGNPSATGNQQRELPESAELLSLLQKQDEIITELYGELDSCKNDLSLIKDQSAIQYDQNRRIFDELRSQIVKNNLGKDLVQSNQIIGANNTGVVALPGFRPCPNCRDLNDAVLKLERDKQKLQNRFLDCEADLNQLRRQDAEHFRKVRESVALVDQAVLEKNEMLVQLKHSQNRIESLEKELKEAMAEHQKSLDQYRKSAQQRYESEIDALKNQLSTVIRSESELKERLNAIVQERDDLAFEKTSTKEKSTERRKEIEERLKNLQSDNTRLTKLNKEISEKLKENEKKWKLENFELSEKSQNLERQLNECRVNFDSNKSALNVSKKENLELRERMAMLEKETWQLRQWKQRLEKDRDETVKNKEFELKEALRIAELKHDQTKMELERLLTNQNGLIFKLKEECKMLADQLERVAKQRRNAKLPQDRFENALNGDHR